ncbi:hypothetical protein, partial [Acetobacter sp.]|uniref:hypothetical protein n=1 Tax=Acetobacter sp. TaxID=440 RepID=UPI0039EC1005
DETTSNGPEQGFTHYQAYDVYYDFNIKYDETEEQLEDAILSINRLNGDIQKIFDVSDYSEKIEYVDELYSF